MRLEPIQVTSPSMPPIGEYMDEISSIWDSRWLTNTGLKHQALEAEICRYLDVGNMALFTNGHLALEAVLGVMELSGEVITTPFTFASTTQAIVRAGLTPVFCDINLGDYTINADKIEALVTEKTCAILPVHVFGNLCDYRKIHAIAQKHGLKVIYDAAHAFGMKVGGLGVGALGDASMFSFHATKVFHTIEGGGVSYSDSALSAKFAAWRQFGMFGKEDAEVVGTNAKMTEFQAAMGLCNLRHVDGEIQKRQAAVNRYRDNLAGRKGLTLCKEKQDTVYNYAYFPVIFNPKQFGNSRDGVAERLADRGILTRKYFYPLTSSFSAYQRRFHIEPTPVAERIAERVLTLPLYADLSLESVDRICKTVLEGAR